MQCRGISAGAQEAHPVICMLREEFAPPLLPQVKPAATETDILQQILNE